MNTNSVEKESEPAVIEQLPVDTGSPIVEDEPENDRHSDIEIIQPNADPLPVPSNHMADTLSGVQDMSGVKDMSANEDKNEISADEIKISRETMLKMMMEINQLKQAHIARENSEQKKSDEVNFKPWTLSPSD